MHDDQRAWRMSRSAHEAISRHVESTYGDEGCGFVFGTGADLVVVPVENIQNRLHGADPDAHPRDARTAYQFDDREAERIIADHEARGLPLRAIFHSHPDHDAYFSETDSAAAAVFGEPNYPGVVYLVWSVREGRTVDAKAFDWSDAAGAFVELPIEID